MRKNAMLTVVNPAIDPLGPLAFELERKIQVPGRGAEKEGGCTNIWKVCD